MKWLIKYIFFFVFVCFSMTIQAEVTDENQSLPRDSSYVLRTTDGSFLEKYKSDPDFNYEVKKDEPFGLWDWIKRWILERLFRMKVSKSSLQVMDAVFYGLIFLVVGGGIFLLIRKGRFALYSKKETFFPEDAVEYNGEQGEDTFIRLQEKAEREEDYVLAVRVAYSGLLQMLDKKHMIRWEASKTNRDYVYEIRDRKLSRDFEELSRIFDCVCYGEFSVDERVYRNIRQRFIDFRKEAES